MPDISVTRRIDASPSEVWAIASDPTRTGEWSPENTGATWLGDATEAAVGARFRGSNKNGWMRWRTTCEVTECEPNQSFAFEVTYARVPIAHWAYRLEADGDGTIVTEEWTNREWAPMAVAVNRLMGVRSRSEFNRAGMEATLEAIAQHLERAEPS